MFKLDEVILEQMNSLFNKGYDPTTIYLGTDMYRELMQHTLNEDYTNPFITNHYISYKGLRVYQVLYDPTHIRVA